jgi:hypothetical protein
VPDDSQRHGPAAWVIGAAAVVLLAVAGYLVASPDVLEKGRLLSYSDQTVWNVRLFNAFDVWVAKESIRALDAVNGLILAAGAGMAAMGALLTRLVAPRTNRFFLITAAGLGYLAADELFGLHKTLGYNVGFLGRAPGTDSPDHVLFALYVFPALVYLVFYWDLLLASRWGTRLMAGGVVLFGVAAELKLVDTGVDEQWLEPVSSLVLVSGLALVALRHLSWSAAAASLRPDAADTRGDRSPSAPA